MPCQDDAQLLIPAANIEQSLRDFPGAYDAGRLQVFHAVRALAQQMNDATSAWLAPFGLTAAKFNYLIILYAQRKSGLTAQALGAQVHTVSASVTSMVDSLVRENLVARTQNPRDGRSTLLRLTPNGERTVRSAAAAHHANVAEMLGALSDPDCAALIGLILRAGNALAHARSPDP
jgi:DNA-binding MarR family transcriptional regulator